MYTIPANRRLAAWIDLPFRFLGRAGRYQDQFVRQTQLFTLNNEARSRMAAGLTRSGDFKA